MGKEHIKYRNSLFAMIATATILGCTDPLVEAAKQDEEGAKKAVLDSLIDPDSAKFGEFVSEIKDGEQKGCLIVNSRNSFGGYTGNQIALVAKFDGKWYAVAIGDLVGIKIDHAACKRFLGKES